MKLPSIESLTNPNYIADPFLEKYRDEKIDYNNFYTLPEEVKSNKEQILKLLYLRKNIFPALDIVFRNDEDIFNASLVNFPSLQYASFSIKNNPDLVRFATVSFHDELQYATQSLKNDNNFIQELFDSPHFVPKNIFKMIPKCYSENKELAIKSLANNADNFLDLSENLKSDREVVSLAVSKNGLLLEHVSRELKNDKQVVLCAIENHVFAYRYASENLKKDHEVCYSAIKKNGIILKDTPEDFKEKHDNILLALETSYDCYFDLPKALKSREYATKSVNKNTYALSKMPEYQNDRNFILTAVKVNGQALEYASDDLKNDYEIVYGSIIKRGINLKYASESLKNNRELAIIAIDQDVAAISYVSPELKKDKQLLLIAFYKNQGSMFSIIDYIDNDIAEAIKESQSDPIDYLEKAIFEEEILARKNYFENVVPRKKEVGKKQKI